MNPKTKKAMKAQNIIALVVTVFAVVSLTSCSTSEKCWAYNSCKSYKSKTFKSYSYARKPMRVRSGKAYGCYSSF